MTKNRVGEIDTSRPHSARMYDYFLGGKDHFAVDEEAAERVVQIWPTVFVCARENRTFMHRATRVLARDHGIRQWLDIGTGIPSEPNLHQVAQALVPEARVVYVDNDPLVLRYAENLMRGTREGRTAYFEADVNEPESITEAPELRDILDFSQPIALSLNALMHFITDAQDPYGLVERLMAPLAPGSALALTHASPDYDPVTMGNLATIYNNAGTPVKFRQRQEVEDFYDGLDLLDPGVVMCHRWRPEADGEPEETFADADINIWAGVGIKR